MKTLKIVLAPEALRLKRLNLEIKFRILGKPELYTGIGTEGEEYFLDRLKNNDFESVDITPATLLEIIIYPEVEEPGEYTDVVFRRWRSGQKDLIAFFPYIIEGSNGYFCGSYQHLGQHSAADYQGLVPDTRYVDPQTDPEAQALIWELQGMGYKLQFIKKVNFAKVSKAREEFRKRR